MGKVAGRPAAIEDGLTLCGNCARLSADAISALPRDYADLAGHLPGIRPPADGMPPAPNKAGSTPPLDVGVDSLMRSIVWAASCWEIPVRAHLGMPEPRQRSVRPGYLTARACLLLAENVEVLASLPPEWAYLDGVEGDPVKRDGIAGLRHLLRLHDLARDRLGLTVRVFRLPGACMSRDCGAADLRRADGDESVYCGVCGRRMPLGHYENLVRLVAGHNIPRLARNPPAGSSVRGT